jgi:hypothetical protein
MEKFDCCGFERNTDSYTLDPPCEDQAVGLFICLSVSLSVSLSVYVCVRPSVCLSVCLPVCLFFRKKVTAFQGFPSSCCCGHVFLCKYMALAVVVLYLYLYVGVSSFILMWVYAPPGQAEADRRAFSPLLQGYNKAAPPPRQPTRTRG